MTCLEAPCVNAVNQLVHQKPKEQLTGVTIICQLGFYLMHKMEPSFLPFQSQTQGSILSWDPL